MLTGGVGRRDRDVGGGRGEGDGGREVGQHFRDTPVV